MGWWSCIANSWILTLKSCVPCTLSCVFVHFFNYWTCWSKSGVFSKHLWSSWALVATTGRLVNNHGYACPFMWHTRKQCQECRHRATEKVKASPKQGGLSPACDEKDSVYQEWKSTSFQDRRASGHTQQVQSATYSLPWQTNSYDKGVSPVEGNLIPSKCGETLGKDWACRCFTPNWRLNPLFLMQHVEE